MERAPRSNRVAIVVMAVPRASLGKAIGIQGAAQAVGLALGPSVGRLLLAAGGRRLIFMINVPFGVLGVVAGLLLIPRSLHLNERVRFDWMGPSLFFPAVVAVLSAISFDLLGSRGSGGCVVVSDRRSRSSRPISARRRGVNESAERRPARAACRSQRSDPRQLVDRIYVLGGVAVHPTQEPIPSNQAGRFDESVGGLVGRRTGGRGD